MIGQCKLCLKTGVELRDSHFLSAGIYRILRDDNEKNPNPWLLTKDAAVQTSSQLKAHLLCHDCEQRFSKNGETWALGRCLPEGRAFSSGRRPGCENSGHRVRREFDANLLRREHSRDQGQSPCLFCGQYFLAWLHSSLERRQLDTREARSVSGAIPPLSDGRRTFSQGFDPLGCRAGHQRRRPPHLCADGRAQGEFSRVQVSDAGLWFLAHGQQEHPRPLPPAVPRTRPRKPDHRVQFA